MSQRITVEEIIAKKKTQEKITVLTAYDYSLAKLVDKAGIDIVLVGDSLANVVLGLDSTLEVGMTEMIHHAKAVNRGVKHALVVGDMPYEAYQVDVFKAVENAKRFIDEAGCDAIKLEWFDQCLEVAEMVIAQGIPVMGHVGLTPQTAEKLGGFKVQGKDAESAKKIIENAKALEAKGCFCVVLECVPFALAEIITKELSIPTIGIGAGACCDGQVLVINDILGLFDRYAPKFIKKYADLGDSAVKAITQFRDEVKSCKFPDIEHSYSMSLEEVNRIKESE